MKRHRRRARKLYIEIGETGPVADMIEDPIDTRSRPRNRAVDAFACQQQRALDTLLVGHLFQSVSDLSEPRKRCEAIQRGYADRRCALMCRLGHGHSA